MHTVLAAVTDKYLLKQIIFLNFVISKQNKITIGDTGALARERIRWLEFVQSFRGAATGCRSMVPKTMKSLAYYFYFGVGESDRLFDCSWGVRACGLVCVKCAIRGSCEVS